MPRSFFSLPPDYVTIGMLRERWLKKQEEEKLKEKQEQDVLEEAQILEKDFKNQPRGEQEVCHRFENNEPRGGVGKDGGQMTLIEEKGKGKEKMGWSGNGRTRNKYYGSKIKNYALEWKKRNGDMGIEKRQIPRPKEELDLVEKKNGSRGMEIILKNKENVGITGFPRGESRITQGIWKRVSVGITEALPKNGVREGSSQISRSQDVRRDGFGGGFGRKENDEDEGFRSKEHGVRLNELKDNNSLGTKTEDEALQIDSKWNGRKRWRRKRNSRKGDKFKQTGSDGLKLNEVEPKNKDEVSEIGNERDHMKGLHSGTGSNDIKQNSVNGKMLTADKLVKENKVVDTVPAEKSRNEGFRASGDRKGSSSENLENLTFGNRKGRYVGSKVERKFGGNIRHLKYGRLVVDWKMKQTSSGMVWVKKEQSGAVGSKAS